MASVYVPEDKVDQFREQEFAWICNQLSEDERLKLLNVILYLRFQHGGLSNFKKMFTHNPSEKDYPTWWYRRTFFERIKILFNGAIEFYSVRALKNLDNFFGFE